MYLMMTIAVGVEKGCLFGSLNSLNRRLYMTNSADDAAYAFDLQHNRVLPLHWSTGKDPYGLCSDEGRLWISCSGDDTVLMIDTVRETRDTQPIGRRPEAIARNPVTGLLYVVAHDDRLLHVIDSDTNLPFCDPLHTERGPHDLAIDSHRNRTYLLNADDGTVNVYQGSNFVQTLDVGGNPRSIMVDEKTGNLYVALEESGQINVLSCEYVSQLVRVGPHPIGLALDQAWRRLYVSDDSDSSIRIVNLDRPSQVSRAFHFPERRPSHVAPYVPHRLFVDQNTHRLYASTLLDNMLLLLMGDEPRSARRL